MDEYRKTGNTSPYPSLGQMAGESLALALDCTIVSSRECANVFDHRPHIERGGDPACMP